ncbi:7,8-didemethyl-8-hydroxy-5-deazariboflavin synthase subunit CofG [Leptolyngbya sp. PCC 6406]|uniref:7,8-didemethyl-8-hydroxy-5-deazariboflavin synthase subunit CofG n=1 Tax=Leptolyngbya sp. PCC 6406 TaxID=1173264 RepID=UPI0002ACBE68|nr:7,8-didemethyl-8-hydroxy-5-deazariboflavin synthase subunit CofG [Leptolyngbya sp. PCC 6406]
MPSTPRRLVTYSPAITLVPTYECFNRCQYCNFRVDPGQDVWLSENDARAQLQKARSQGAIEALILSGEVHPASTRRAPWLQHIYRLCELALAIGLLPHTNVGPLSREEMAQLQQVNVSMGLMVEQVTPRLLQGVHRHAPSKDPDLRLEQLEQAGRLGIPFTTGLLLGIGETVANQDDTLTAIACCHHRWGHIQEVILQPYQPGHQDTHEPMGYGAAALVAAIARARALLPDDITLQVPPNLLSSSQFLIAALAAGARDLGGIGPIDEVNPDHPHPTIAALAQDLDAAGWQIQPRLPVYPAYDGWLNPALGQRVRQWRQHIATKTSEVLKTSEV